CGECGARGKKWTGNFLPHGDARVFCRSGPGATKRPCLFLVRKRRGNTPTRAPSFFHLMDNQQVCINMSFFNAHANHQMLTSIKNTGFHV
ncbi:hypothetical protein, partial [Aneurinibacillus aneurinilyticus]|uniref:hypothetical protein n=1 Tax=Aneurinibacillus aneurinilyticus TaxID=1391 RepID=UPI003D20EE75